MATCKLCERSGWLVALDENGLCDQCQRFHLRGIVDHRRVVLEALEIIESSRNPVTRLSRINVAIKKCIQLEPYDRKGIQTLETPPREIVRELARIRNEIVKDEIREQVHSARRQSKNATTASGKLEGYNRAIENISSLIDELDDASLAESAIIAIHAERDTLHFVELFQKGEAAEGEGNTKKALEIYNDAMAKLKNGSAPRPYQDDRIAEVRKRITNLGGNVPH